ncbi:MAG: hypothetical protein QOF27_29, partial [Gaiellaceae bacterium]|nr:hypothetical protein [Gaiellaceae bacterium]
GGSNPPAPIVRLARRPPGTIEGEMPSGRVLAKLLVAALVAALALSLAGAAVAAPTPTTFAVVGYEYAFTSTVGCFAGTATGNAGDTATWSACVQHDPLGSVPTYVNGGSLAMVTRSSTGALDAVTGSFVYHGGTITTINPGASCTNQQYLVTGALQGVATTTTSGGSGNFSVVLTHYRISLFGHCIIYKARVSGTASFAY